MKIMLLLTFVLVAPVSMADDVAPDVLLSATTLEVIAILKQDKDLQAGNPSKVADVVETRILPLFDFERMARIAMARNWRVATREQQKTIATEFKTLDRKSVV